MNIATLLEAADYLERKDRDHGYATSQPMPVSSRRKSKTRKIQGSRTSHNELEKNRRAHLRHCLESLKKIVPLSSDSTRHTTLGLLIDAQNLVKNLEQKEIEQRALREQLKREQKYLRCCLEQRLSGTFRFRPGHLLSECSTGSSSSASTSEPDEVDIVSYGSSGLSDSDDLSSLSCDGNTGALVNTISPFNQMVL